MKTVLVTNPFEAKVVKVKTPQLPSHGLLLSVKASGICGSDLRPWKEGIASKNGIGHEVVGVVIEASNAATKAGWREGMRVIPLPVPCGRCGMCLTGNEQMCPSRTHAGFEGPGGFSEILPIPALTLRLGAMLAVPDDLDDVTAVLCEPLACVLNGQEKLNICPGKSVWVIGSGPIGVSHAFLARKRGASTVFLSDVIKKRLDMADWVKADHYVNAGGKDPVDEAMRLTNGKGVDIVIVCCSSPDAQAQAVHMASRLGRVLYFSGLAKGSELIPIDISAVHRKEIVLLGARNAARRHFSLAFEMLLKHDWNRIVTHVYSLDETQKGFEKVNAGCGMKVVIKP